MRRQRILMTLASTAAVDYAAALAPAGAAAAGLTPSAAWCRARTVPRSSRRGIPRHGPSWSIQTDR
jgi:hypothetical protein